jgi:hypothetical protein
VIVIFASPYDGGASRLAESWASHGAAVLTHRDLSRPGWRHFLPRRHVADAVVDGRHVAVSEISGVLIRWPAVFEQELVEIVQAERTYVASEMTAFLRSWLTQLECPVVNRPSAGSLVGPSWRPERWVHIAARLGIPVRTVRRRVAFVDAVEQRNDHGEHASVTVVGERCIGPVHPELAAHARRLAQAAGATLLAVHFSTPDAAGSLLSADPMPEIDDEVGDAILDHLLGRSVSS